MFNLNSNLLSGATSWDTNYARTYLQISKDQLEKINEIPGWSKNLPDKDKTAETIEKQLAQLTSPSTEHFLTTSTNISAKDNNNLKIQNNNSDLQSKENSVSDKEIFLKNFSLSPLKKNNESTFSLKRSNSLPDLYLESLSHNEPEGFSRKRTLSAGKDILNSKVPLISDDGLDPDKLIGINSHKSFSCPLKQSNKTLKQKPVKTLDDNILNHKYLKDVSDADPLSSNGADQVTLKQELSSFGKRLLLLEKRFSPSKELGLSSFNTKLTNIKNSNYEKNLKSSQNFEIIGETMTFTDNHDSVKNLPDKIQNSSMSKSYGSLESKIDPQPSNKKSDAFDKDGTTAISKTAISNFDSLLSPEIPCGQPVPTEVPSQSELFPSQESSKLSTLTKFQNDSSPVPCGQPLPMEVPSATDLIPSQKLAKLNTQSQNAKLLDSKMMPEKTSDTFSVFSASSNEKASDLVSNKELGRKRKHRSRSEKSSKKLDAKRMKRIDIQFSSTQIKSMLDIMKLFHTKV